MAEYVLVDKEKFIADLTTIADVIREKANTTEKLEFPNGYKNTIEVSVGSLDSLIDGSITEITSNVTSIVEDKFQHSTNLTTASFPNVTQIEPNVFYGCQSLTTVNLPKVTSIGIYGFNGCSNLATIDLPKLTSIDMMAFRDCSKLATVILRSETICTLAKNGFMSTSIASGTGYIYVPQSLIENYKVATNWSAFASQFRALEDYTVDGTITGELDDSKI